VRLPQAARTPKSPRNPIPRATRSPPAALAVAHQSAHCLPVRAVPRLLYHGAVHRLAPKHEVAPLFKAAALLLAQARPLLRRARRRLP
jgi:hypothetical protein